MDSLSQYSKHSDELNAGASEIINNETKQNKIVGIASTKKVSEKTHQFDKKVLPDLQMSYHDGGQVKKGFGITASDSEQDGLKQLPMIKGGGGHAGN